MYCHIRYPTELHASNIICQIHIFVIYCINLMYICIEYFSSERELTELLEDRTFVDYLSVYLMLPVRVHFMLSMTSHCYSSLVNTLQVFSQKLIFLAKDRKFEYDPDIETVTHVRFINILCT